MAVGQDDDTGLSCDIAQRVIREFMAPRTVTDMDGTPFGGAAGAVGVCHIVSRHVAITFSISRAQRANHAVFALCRGEKTSCNNVFDKSSAEGKSRSVCTMPRRENVM